ncbi:glycogen synthase kinase binding protein [Latimeria chalumnae]|uniref:glycogen synthase kinase binding protein n=1 Tax=Latimeria chalumnae TaxID=7897 RepID=UPI0003C15FC4|nr:PREDICTED: GSK-3-binding protein FRAT2 [Latimeria chalumnae]|eukprot:XP_006003505.1 PREDICTED: GSK-3-binding protein FRAT2 [Latimeria chalumnae]
MPCRKESFFFLEQSVTVDSGEVDALVVKIGEALQITATSRRTAPCCCASGKKQHAVLQSSRSDYCIRLQNRNPRSRSTPYSTSCGSVGEQACLPAGARNWSQQKKDAMSVQTDDPHQLLQELILSGNLVKEAVRRLQLSAARECEDQIAPEEQQ